MALSGLVLFLVFLWRLPTLNQILILSILSVTMPPVSFDYTLLSLYAAFGMLCMLAISADKAGVQVKSLTAQLMLFAVIMTPESFMIISGVRLSGQLRALCLLASVLLALRYPLDLKTVRSELSAALPAFLLRDAASTRQLSQSWMTRRIPAARRVLLSYFADSNTRTHMDYSQRAASEDGLIASRLLALSGFAA